MQNYSLINKLEYIGVCERSFLPMILSKVPNFGSFNKNSDFIRLFSDRLNDSGGAPRGRDTPPQKYAAAGQCWTASYMSALPLTMKAPGRE